tara:strand:+ start:242 stop:466 length:225 start_codon:yes stop_codon:yes gene_type:complete
MLTDEEKTNLKLLKFLYSLPTARLREERDECYKDITRMRELFNGKDLTNWIDTLNRLEGKAEAIDEILKDRNAT